MKARIRGLLNFSFHKISFAKLFLLTSISLFIPTSISYLILINLKDKDINNSNYLFQDSKLLGYEWVDFKPSSEFIDLESYEIYFDNLKNNNSNNLPKELTNFISSQYRHEPLKYKCSYNWLGCILEKTKLPYISETLFVLKPVDIAKSKNAFCSQQAILVQHILSNLGLNYTSVGISYFDKNNVLQGHFFTITFINGKSYIIDTDMYPNVDWKGGYANNFLSKSLSVSTFYEMYSKNIDLPKKASELNLEIILKDYNTYPASNGLLLQNIVENLSHYGWAFTFLLFLIINYYPYKKINNK